MWCGGRNHWIMHLVRIDDVWWCGLLMQGGNKRRTEWWVSSILEALLSWIGTLFWPYDHWWKGAKEEGLQNLLHMIVCTYNISCMYIYIYRCFPNWASRSRNDRFSMFFPITQECHRLSNLANPKPSPPNSTKKGILFCYVLLIPHWMNRKQRSFKSIPLSKFQTGSTFERQTHHCFDANLDLWKPPVATSLEWPGWR